MQAIILAGGFGKRLQSVITDVPKPMATIHNQPFLAYLLDYLKIHGFTQVILSVHYLRTAIENYFANNYQGIAIQYAIETEPLGTGGAIINSLKVLNPQEPVFVMNGDTFMKINYVSMYAQHLKTRAQLSLALRKVSDCSRYGEVEVANQKIINFQYPGKSQPGFITAGTYIIHPQLFSDYALEEKFSFEQDFLHLYINKIKPQAFMTDDYFIDIGIPEDYARAVRELPQLSAVAR